MTRKEVAAMLATNEQLTARVEELSRQFAWLKQQVFGVKSERRLLDSDGRRLALDDRFLPNGCP